jgi:AcrR family transcriptional regulator
MKTPRGLTADNAARWAALSLREKKLAHTRLSLLDATLELLEERPFADIRVQDLCKRAGVSDATFFNHFGAKPELLLYFVQLWSLDVGSRAGAFDPRAEGGLAVIERVFAATAEAVRARPRVMAEVVAHQATHGRPESPREVSEAERLLRFPERDGVCELPARGLDAIVAFELGRAVKRGELARDADLEALSLAVASVFLGTPAALGPSLHPQLELLWQRQLELLWRGARASPAAPETRERPATGPRSTKATRR